MDTDNIKPGDAFTWHNLNWICLACNVTDEPLSVRNNKKSIKWMLCNHSYQSLKAKVFFRFYLQLIENLPYDIHEDIILRRNECSKFNLILNARFDSRTWLFLMKQPIYLKQQMLCKNKYSNEHFQLKKAFSDLCNGYFKEFEFENNIEIPLVISTIIKNYIDFGPAEFYCSGFKKPLFGVIDKQFAYYDSA